MMPARAIIGFSDHGGWAVAVTATSDGQLLDRRRIDLVDAGLPKIPIHSEARALPLGEAIALVERVRKSAELHAKRGLEALAETVPSSVVGIALRHCPELPPTIAERIQIYTARNVADWVMYRMALAAAAETRGWAVHWYNARNIMRAAGEALGVDDAGAHFLDVRRSIGPPWGRDHRIAMAAAIVAAQPPSRPSEALA